MIEGQKRRLATWAVWPLAVLVAGLFFAGPAPWYPNWDNFAYLDAALTGKGYAPLGFGRPVFCKLGEFFALVAKAINPTDIFSLYRVWSAAGLLFLAASLSTLLWSISQRVNEAAAFLFGGAYVLHIDSLELWLEVWPENWARATGFFAAAFLLLPRGNRWLWLVCSIVAAVLMVWIKETAASFLPGLAILALATERGNWRRRLMIVFVWFAAASATGVSFHFLSPKFIDGLAESQRDWLGNQFSGENAVIPGLQTVMTNSAELWRTLWQSPGQVVTGFAGLVFGLLSFFRVHRFDARTWTILSAVALLTGPWLFVTLTGATMGMARYSREFIPGLLMMAVVPLISHRPDRVELWQKCYAAIAVFVFVMTLQSGQLARHERDERGSYIRYLHMQTLCGEGVALIAGHDAWAAHFVHLQTVGGMENYKWAIAWSTDAQGLPPEAWLEEQRLSGRRIAVHDSVPSGVGIDLNEYLARLPGEYTWHFSGWRLQEREQ